MLSFPSGQIKGLILDMDGVLWRGYEPIGNLKSIFDRIAASNLQVILATNAAIRDVSESIEKMASFGIHLEPWQAINSAEVAGLYLKRRYPGGGNVYVLGEDPLKTTLHRYGFNHQDNGDVLAVVAGLDRQLTYDHLKHAALLIRDGIPFLGTNPDRTFPMPFGEVPGAGAVLAALEAATDVTPQIMGKPEPEIFLACLDRMQLSPQDVVAVGDRLDTDIAGGQRMGCFTALVLSGVTTAEQAAAWSPPIDWIGADLTSLLDDMGL